MKSVSFPGGVGYIWEPGDPVGPTGNFDGDRPVIMAAVEVVQKQVADKAAASADSTVQALIGDGQALMGAIKASTGALTLSKAQQLTIAKALLYLLKEDKTVINAAVVKV